MRLTFGSFGVIACALALSGRSRSGGFGAPTALCSATRHNSLACANADSPGAGRWLCHSEHPGFLGSSAMSNGQVRGGHAVSPSLAGVLPKLPILRRYMAAERWSQPARSVCVQRLRCRLAPPHQARRRQRAGPQRGQAPQLGPARWACDPSGSRTGRPRVLTSGAAAGSVARTSGISCRYLVSAWYRPSMWARAVSILVAQAVVLLIATRLSLRRHESG